LLKFGIHQGQNFNSRSETASFSSIEENAQNIITVFSTMLVK